MTRSGWLKLATWTGVALVLGLVLVLLSPADGAASSTLSRQSSGWWALWSYAQARGVEVERLDRPLDEVAAPEPPGTLVLGFPWQAAQRIGESAAVEDHLRAGGTVLAAYALDRFTDLQPMWSVLGCDATDDLRGAPPVSPTAWWDFRHERWQLAPTDLLPRGPRLEIPALDAVPTAPAEARVLYRANQLSTRPDTPLIWIHPRQRGQVVVVPAELLSNAELRSAANADLVETLFQALPAPWHFDEFHHGHADPQAIATSDTAYHWDLFLLHLGVLYLLGAWALGRGFGRPWIEPVPHHGSASAFLRSLGELHHKLGHHGDAARTLLQRVAEYEPDGRRDQGDTEDRQRAAESVDGGAALVTFARSLAGKRSHLLTESSQPSHPSQPTRRRP